jgi:hypothetical protein
MSRMDKTLRTQPLPTLPRRRQMIRERLAKEQAELDQFGRLAADANLSLRAAAAARRKVRTAKWAVDQLTKALDYLGEPDPRLDLYRLFGMDLPPEPPTQLQLPLPRPHIGNRGR